MPRVSGIRVILFGPADEIGEVPEHVSVVDAPVSIAKDPDPARAVRRDADASIVRAVAAVTAGEADALVSGGSTGAALAASLFGFKRARGVHRPALAILVPVPGARSCCSTRARTSRSGPSTSSSSRTWARRSWRRSCGVASPRVALLANGTEATKGTENVVAAHERSRRPPA